jgi:hypothetical protein
MARCPGAGSCRRGEHTVTPEEATDKLEIIELCTLNHWIYDHDDWDAYDEVFADEVSFPGADVVDPDAYLDGHLVTREALKDALKGFKSGLITQHLIAGHRVELQGETAICRAHSINIHFPADNPADEALLAKGNDYRFDCIRTNDGWRIRGFLATTRWSWGNDRSHDAGVKLRKWQDSQA